MWSYLWIVALKRRTVRSFKDGHSRGLAVKVTVSENLG